MQQNGGDFFHKSQGLVDEPPFYLDFIINISEEQFVFGFFSNCKANQLEKDLRITSK